MRDVKKQNPAANVNLQYDKLFVNHRCYVWSDIQGKVVEYSPVKMILLLDSKSNVFSQKGEADSGRPGSVLARSSSVMSVSGQGGSPTKRKVLAHQSAMWRSSSCMSDLDQDQADFNQVQLCLF